MLTNDKNNPRITLTISGQVDKFVTITPSNRVSLNGTAGQKITSAVTIIPEPNYQFKIIESRAVKGTDIAFKLEEVKKENRSEYVVTVENMKKESGKYFDTVMLKTDSKVQQEIKISVYGNISDAVKSDGKAEAPKG